jgi:UDP-N-acetylmuramoyl-tripeptide--D-alanyl-D-alanine ligase
VDVKISELLGVTGGQLIGKPDGDMSFSGISTDTRSLKKGDLFFALSGRRFDAHDFILEAAQKGAAGFVIANAQKIPSECKKSAVFIVVEDALKAYGDLAKWYRQKFKIPAIAITGSSGKTTVKELVSHTLSQNFHVLKNKGTENNFVGVPKTIFSIESSHQMLVLEMGTSGPGEIDRLSSIIKPCVGIVTQIGQAHLEGLGSREGIKQEKLKILNHLERGGILILNGQDPMLEDVRSGVHKVLRVGFEKNKGQDFWADQIWLHEQGASFYLNGKDLFETRLLGRHNVFNCLLAITTALSFGVELGVVQKAIASFEPVPGRLCPKNIEGIYFLDDSYNSNPDSFLGALQMLKDLKIRERKGVVCGDMLELGEAAQELHRQMGAAIAGLLFDFVIATGPFSKFLIEEAVKNGFDAQRIYQAKDSAEAGKLCRKIALAGDRVLVKGSRGMKMERVFECFTNSSTR